MKIGLIGINSQFVHSNLALYYLRENLPPGMTGEIREFNQNEPLLSIFYALMEGGFDVAAFSVYLWNRETVVKLTGLLKAASPQMILILGGPEPTYAPEDFSDADFIVAGALETSWPPLLKAIAGEGNLDKVPGLYGDVCFAADWKFPYREEDLPGLEHKLVYYETSRGCPYRCAFCLSSAEEHTAYLPLERVKRELDFFLKHQIPVVKLVDRTFNAPVARGKEILRYLLDHYVSGVTFHFELKGELLDEETMALLAAAPRDYFQVEIGIQSLNGETLAVSSRNSQWQRVKAFYRRLIAAGNVHTHFDLIAGLPHEDMASFAAGFNEVMSIAPHYLQVGFLKLLPGTKLAREGELHGFVAETFPPYEVVQTRELSTADLGRLKKLDGFMDAVYNRGLLRQTLRYANHREGCDSFALFCALADSADIGITLQEILPQDDGVWPGLMRLDAFLSGSGGEVTPAEEREANAFAQDKATVVKLLPHYEDTAPREIYKRIRLLRFPVSFVFDDDGNLDKVAPGSCRVLLDYRAKGKQRRGKTLPDLYVF